MEFPMRLRNNNMAKRRLQIKRTQRKESYKKTFSCRNDDRCLCRNFENTCNIEFPQIWKDLFVNGQLTDGVIRCRDGKEFKIHRVILSAVSPYFRVLFTNSINRDQSERYETKVLAPSTIFKLLLDYAYTGICQINKTNVKSLLIYADKYAMLAIVQKCCDFLSNDLNAKNCLEILAFANRYFCCKLSEKCRRYVLKNFLKIANKSKQFFYLNADELAQFLKDDELNVRNEQVVLDIILKWVKYRKKIREVHLVRLLKCIRFGHLENESMLEILKNPMIQFRKDSYDYVKSINDMFDDLFSGEIETSTIDRRFFRYRISQDVLFAIGGWNIGRPTNFIETYNLCTNRWLISSHSEYIPRAYHGTCTLNNSIYIIGGFDGSQYFNTVRKYDPINYKWSDCACMYDHRCYVSVITHNNKIYAMGGYNGRFRLRSFERYDLDKNQWELMPPMNKQRSDAGATVLDNKIYIVGGFNGQEVMRSGEVFDIEQNQWSFIPQMISPRSGVSLVTYNRTIYAFGGFNGEIRMKNGEKYIPSLSKRWTEISDMMTARSNFATAILDDSIFVIGGFNGTSTVSFVEYYDPIKDEWYKAASMNLARSALSAVVISDLPNIREYSYETYNNVYRW